MSKPKTDAEYKEWSDKLTKMRLINAHQVAEMKDHKAKVAMKKRAEEEKKEIEEHKKRLKEIIEKAKKADAAANNKHGGRRTRRK
jgi:hypothetical protein